MQTIKGLTVLVLVAVVVFIVAAGNNIKNQARYAARMHSPALAETAGKTAESAAGGVESSKTTTNSAGKIVGVGSKASNQGWRKIPAT